MHGNGMAMDYVSTAMGKARSISYDENLCMRCSELRCTRVLF